MKIYLVGGAVRDKLLGLPVKDRDWVVVGATPDDMLAQDFQLVGKSFPVFLHPQSKEEYALARTERKTGPGYTGFEVDASANISLEADLQRRDLTINAIAEDEQGHIIDPFNGQTDLQQRILRHISPAFVEDPVRLLRVARFMARFAELGFTVAAETMTLLSELVDSGEVDNLISERIWQEMHKALVTAHPNLFFSTLNQCGALGRILPEVVNDVSIQSQRTLIQACRLSSNPEIRFASWAQPMGTDNIKAICSRLRTPKEYQELALMVSNHHHFFHQCTELPPPDILTGLKALDAFRRPERFEHFLLAAEAVSKAEIGRSEWPHPQREYLHTALTHASAITSKDITKINLQGKALAEELDVHRRATISKVKRTYRWAKFT